LALIGIEYHHYRGDDGARRTWQGLGGEMPFISDVLVREISADWWQLIEPLEYVGKSDHFIVEKGFKTDFASVPKIFTWLLPRYGRYTKAAILHDWLCQRAEKGLIDRADADGIFRRSMRELGVAFLKRWLMWGAVRLDAAIRFGLKDLLRPTRWDLLRFLAVFIVGLGYVVAPGAVIIAALLLFYLAEWATYMILHLTRRIPQPERGPSAAPKAINRPRFRWTP
jgi:hypothetical protein